MFVIAEAGESLRVILPCLVTQMHSMVGSSFATGVDDRSGMAKWFSTGDKLFEISVSSCRFSARIKSCTAHQDSLECLDDVLSTKQAELLQLSSA